MTTTAEQQTIPVSERALIGRINRRLRHEGRLLRTARGQAVVSSVGRFYVIDINRNWIVWQNIDLEALGRELGVLQPWERMEEQTDGR